jgi:uncharacterized protein (TIGR00251 family)
MTWYAWRGDDLVLELRVTPRAKRDEFAGAHGERMRLRIAAVPADGEANAAMIRFIATEFGVPRSRVVLEHGQTGRDKRVVIRRPGRLPASIAFVPRRPGPG